MEPKPADQESQDEVDAMKPAGAASGRFSNEKRDAAENQRVRTESVGGDVASGKTAGGRGPSLEIVKKPHSLGDNEIEYEYIDVVWLKKDARWADHGPLSEVAGVGGNRRRKFVILYLYEPDQLREHSVHGSHLRFVHEGLVDMESRLKDPSEKVAGERSAANTSPTTADAPLNNNNNKLNGSTAPSFEYLTVCHNTIISTLNSIHFRYLAPPPPSTEGAGPAKRKYYKIARLLAHEETGHWQSYMRDRSVRKWCKIRSIPFLEFNQTGVTRRLTLRDDYLKLWKAFMAKPMYPEIDLETATGREAFRSRLIQLRNLPGFVSSRRGIANLFDSGGDHEIETEPDSGRRILEELPAAHRSDRRGRQQFGGETRAKQTLDSFVLERGARYSQHISSPNSSWNSCSRLSVYLTWGHISLRCVLRVVEARQDELRRRNIKGSPWLKSLQAFASRAHWRSHFVQKLESEPTLELRDLCPAYQHLRRQEGDWDPRKYTAWETGTTGYPFVDACMRCLIEHGWINFRMRAMLVSFATYNLWLDWKGIAPHLARVFLDYEPGIHYPQLQMQAGTTGINAMRVYNVTKQGKDQDPRGIFIRRYVPELRDVPLKYIHEPWKMSEALKDKYYKRKPSPFSKAEPEMADEDDRRPYPEPIVDEGESAKTAKQKVNDVKKALATRIQANQVYIKHGSRSRRSNEMNHRGSGSGALPAVVVMEAGAMARSPKGPGPQPKIRDAFLASAASVEDKGKARDVVDLTSKAKKNPTKKRSHGASSSLVDLTTTASVQKTSFATPTKRLKPAPTTASKSIGGTNKITDLLVPRQGNANLKTRTPGANTNSSNVAASSEGSWSCVACTFLNDKPHGLMCSMCGTAR